MKIKQKVSAAIHEDEIQEEIEKDELEAEIRAVMEIRNERSFSEQVKSLEHPIDGANFSESQERLIAYNKSGLKLANESLAVSGLPFIETLQITDFEVLAHDENEDIEREMAFYNQTLLAVGEGRRRLQGLGVPFKRPRDYFCEHVKSDGHMSRIKDRLLLEEKKIAAFEQRKQKELNRKYDKQISEGKKALKSQKRDSSEGLSDDSRGPSQAKKGRFEGQAKNERGDSHANHTPSRRKQVMDKKYGSGTKERMKAKLTDKKSLNDLSDFNPRGGKSIRRDRASSDKPTSSFKKGRGGGSGKKSGKANRPGKEARKQKRASNQSS